MVAQLLSPDYSWSIIVTQPLSLAYGPKLYHSIKIAQILSPKDNHSFVDIIL